MHRLRTAISPVAALNAVAVTVLSLAFGLSFAALVFSGSLKSGLGLAIDAALIAIVIGGLCAAWKSAFPFAIGGPDSNPTAVLAALAATVGAAASRGNAVPTVLMITALATLSTGVLFFALGRFGGGRIIRLVPQPMIAGFNAASGVLVLLGALRVLVGMPLRFTTLSTVLVPLHASQIGVGVAFGILLIALRRWFGPASIATAFVCAIVGTLGVAWVGHYSFEALRADGWLFALPPHVLPWLPWTTNSSTIDWSTILKYSPDIVVVALVAAAALLLNDTGLELISGRDVDLDRELRMAGLGNILSAALGSMPTYTTFSRSATNYALGTRSRTVGVIAAVVAAAVIFVGPDRAMGFVPVFAPAGLLVAVGCELAYQWLFANRSRQALGDTITIWLIVATVIVAGFVVGILVGLAAGCVAFVVRYSRIDSVEHRLTAATLRSRLQRSRREVEILLEHGQNVCVFALRGYVFFGVADRIYRELLSTAKSIDGPGWIIVDCTSVTGMDSSVAGVFVKLLRNIDGELIHVVFAGMGSRVASVWNAVLENDLRPLSFDDADHAMEWCETELLRLFDSYSQAPATLDLWLSEQFGRDLAAVVREHLERVDLDTGDVLCAAGETSDRMFFIASGRVAVIIGENEFRRFISIGSNAMIGEMGLYRHMQRNATVVAEEPTVAYALSRDALDIIETEHPAASTAFHAAIIRTLAERLEYQNALLSTLLQ